MVLTGNETAAGMLWDLSFLQKQPSLQSLAKRLSCRSREIKSIFSAAELATMGIKEFDMSFTSSAGTSASMLFIA
ncbi:MAG: hypothetical protein ACSLEM_00505 [Candidatus Malihini olakiniferum]